ncbi:hypothetical protein EDB87DRAFT_1337629 [Lactarius vividus]|nr:hypothetical protein EDB87DRAFT_214050 [Lactarius vividus]KAH9055343.1 hypothetical protein EDB87DRAFT_1337629 [Lactarius vividus]
MNACFFVQSSWSAARASTSLAVTFVRTQYQSFQGFSSVQKRSQPRSPQSSNRGLSVTYTLFTAPSKISFIPGWSAKTDRGDTTVYEKSERYPWWI